ncbi:hypothetical protein [Streptomyces sp. NPDC089919]|uniref:hypothetical protein n=1 Tax=Streptomyces sp. NPDC089919 TaxID=3155188 RepID=UPI0034186995
MNRKTLRTGAVALVAALAFGAAAATAQAVGQPTPAPAASSGVAVTMTHEQAARELASNLLKYEGDRFTASERAELQSIANGTAPQAYGKLDALLKLLKKVKGFASAVAKKYDAFKAWYNGLPWYIKGPLQAAGVGYNLYDIWSLFN